MYRKFFAKCKKSNFCTRQQQTTEQFAGAFDDLAVHTITLRCLGEVKEYLRDQGHVHTITGVTRPRSFKLLKLGVDQVSVGMKEYMHSQTFRGIGADEWFTGPPHSLFVAGISCVELTTPWRQKRVDPVIIAKVQQLRRRACQSGRAVWFR